MALGLPRVGDVGEGAAAVILPAQICLL